MDFSDKAWIVFLTGWNLVFSSKLATWG